MELIINTFGTSLNRQNEQFVISNKDGRQILPATGIRSIQLSNGAQITSDAVLLAIDKEIEILFVNKQGTPMGRIWSPKYGSISTIRKGQLAFTYTPDALTWIKQVICQKIENQQALLLMMQQEEENTRKKVEKAVRRLEDYRTKINALSGEWVHDVAASLRGWEGIASKIYFQTMNLFIPEKYQFTERSQHPAKDVVNAFLNYGYGLLYGKVEGALIKAGVDPYIGILHRDDYNRPVLVYDVIEIYRVWIDYVVYLLVAQNIITDEYYSIKEDGSYWLENLGRRVLIQSVNDYLEEVVLSNGIQRTRNYQLFLYTQELAQKFKKYC